MLFPGRKRYLSMSSFRLYLLICFGWFPQLGPHWYHYLVTHTCLPFYQG